MRNRRPYVLVIAFGVAASVADLPPVSASSDLQVDSREYKVMLEASRFRGSNPLSAIHEMWNGQIRQRIEDLDGVAPGSGSFELEKDRAVRFWDTSGGGACFLRKHGYAFRERVKVKKGQEVDKKREVTLKFRGQEAKRVSVKDMHGIHADAKQKFELDIGTAGEPGSPLRLVYSKSTKQPIGKDKNINRVIDILELYPGLAGDLEEDGVTVDPNQNLARVSDLTVRERVYEEAVVDLGGREAKLSLTLWYDGSQGSLAEPLLAELSFKIKTSEQSPEFSVATLYRAEALFRAIAGMPWADANASTKTSFIYQHRNFCPQ